MTTGVGHLPIERRAHGRGPLARAGRRSIFALALVCTLLVLWLLPAAGLAGSWPIRDAHAVRMGTVRETDADIRPEDYDTAIFTVWRDTSTPLYCGKMTYWVSEFGRAKGLWPLTASDGSWLGILVRRRGADRFDVMRQHHGWHALGSVRRGPTGPWRLHKRVGTGDSVRGTAPRGCPGQAAAGAATLLGLFGRIGPS